MSFMDNIEIDYTANKYLQKQISATSRQIANLRWHESDVPDYSNREINFQFKFEGSDKESFEKK